MRMSAKIRNGEDAKSSSLVEEFEVAENNILKGAKAEKHIVELMT